MATSHSASSSTGVSITDRVEAAPGFAAAVERGVAVYPGFEVTVRPATSGTIRMGLRCPERSNALEYGTGRTLDAAQLHAYGIGLFQRLDHLLDALGAELKGAHDGLAREETNVISYTDQLARPFEHEQALLFAQRELARIDRKLTHYTGSKGQPGPPCISAARDNEAAG
jgi:hypothetical protein